MTSTSPICVGLEMHRSSVDLQMLPHLVDDMQWVPLTAAPSAQASLVLPGLWMADSPRQASELLRERCSAGLHTIVVPRFRAGALTAILGCPSSVEILPAEFKSFEWGSHHAAIPGFTVIKTALHAGKWGEAPGVGTVLLAYRPHMAAGAIVLCAAMIASRVVGVSSEIQKNLLRSIIKAASAPIASPVDSIEAVPPVQPASVDEFLLQERELGAAYLLSRLATAQPDLSDLTAVAKEHLGILLPPEDVVRLKQRVPPAPVDEIRLALQRFGWGAYLRRLPTQSAESNRGIPNQ
jgi:hypothetical protein